MLGGSCHRCSDLSISSRGSVRRIRRGFSSRTPRGTNYRPIGRQDMTMLPISRYNTITGILSQKKAFPTDGANWRCLIFHHTDYLYFEEHRFSFPTPAWRNSKELQYRHVDIPIACLEEHLCTADVKRGQDKNLINIEGDGIETPKSIDEPKKLMAVVASPSQFTQLGGKVTQNFLMPENPREMASVTSGTDSSLMEITLDNRKVSKGTVI
uniref:Uncharacterized protein n=1 Tax=Fagus sylvatica TaxID=28930 RepID=A0A2N9F701_FAGSY